MFFSFEVFISWFFRRGLGFCLGIVFFRFIYFCLGFGIVVEMDDEVDFFFRSEEGRVVGVDEERGV